MAIPDIPYTRTEMYLDAIARNGGGGGSGGGGGVLVVNEVYDESTDTYTLDKTWQEIHDADYAIIKSDADSSGSMEIYPIASILYNSFKQSYEVSFAYPYLTENPGQYVITKAIYATPSADGYPVSVSDE